MTKENYQISLDLEKFTEEGADCERIHTEFINNEQQIIVSNKGYEEGVDSKRGFVPEYRARLKSRILEVPEEIDQASGIRIHGKNIKSLLFTTDVAVMSNHNAHAVIAVYPFTPQYVIMQAIASVSTAPVFFGVGGGLTSGSRSVQIAFQAEQLGGLGVVVNSPMPLEVIDELNQTLDIPVVTTLTRSSDNYIERLNAGASILNVSGGVQTTEIVRQIRQAVGPAVPIIATGGPSGDSILRTIEAGANAITYTPPSSQQILSELMKDYRNK